MSLFVSVFFSIWGVLSALFPFVVLLGILIFIHELGHFMVARFCGVKVEVFSLGFGKKLIKWKKGDTLYCVSLFPLGGYVKMFGHEYGKEVEEKEKSVAFLHKKLWQRMAIVLAGPLMNFFLAAFIFTCLSMFSGDRRAHPVVGELDLSRPAAQAGLVYGDRIISIDEIAVKNIKEVRRVIFNKPDANLSVKVQNPSGEIQIKKVPSTKGLAPGKWGFLETGGVVEGLVFSTAAAVVGVTSKNSPSGKAGVQTFDQILSVNEKKVNNRKELFHFLNHPSSSDSFWKIKVQRGKEVKNLVLNLPKDYREKPEVTRLGLARSDLFIADLKKNGVAEKAGLEKGDFIFKLNGELVPSWPFLVEKIKSFDEKNGPLKMEIKRQEEMKSFSLVPEMRKQIIDGTEKKHYMLGIVARSPHVPAGGSYIEKQTNPFKAMTVGLNKTFHWCAVVVVYIKKFITGEISRRTLGGAISIGRVAYDSYSYGLEYFFKIMAILSVQLFLINILPIPVFDGGHLLFYIIEFFNGAPLSMKKMIIAQQLGVLLLLFLLLFTTFNDLHNWLFIW